MQKVHIFKSILSLTSVVGWMGAGGGVPHVLNLFLKLGCLKASSQKASAVAAAIGPLFCSCCEDRTNKLANQPKT